MAGTEGSTACPWFPFPGWDEMFLFRLAFFPLLPTESMPTRAPFCLSKHESALATEMRAEVWELGSFVGKWGGGKCQQKSTFHGFSKARGKTKPALSPLRIRDVMRGKSPFLPKWQQRTRGAIRNWYFSGKSLALVSPKWGTDFRFLEPYRISLFSHGL